MMWKRSLLAACVAVGAVVLAVSAADEKKALSIGEIMKKGHGSKGLMKGIEAEAKDGKWDDAQKDAKLLKAFGEALGSNKPPKGSADSWKKLTDQYKSETAAIAAAAEKKDASGVVNAIKTLKKSCEVCHKAHQDE